MKILKMKILKWYIFREFIWPYLGSMAFFTMLLLMERVMSFVRLVASGYANIFDLFTLVFYSIPPTLAITMPMSTIMGALVAVSRLSNDGEITAMRAAGIRVTSIFISLYIVGTIIGISSFFLTDRLVPIGNIKFRTLYQKLTIARPTIQIDIHSINKISGNVTMLVENVDDKTGDLVNITLFQKEKGKYARTITSKKGYFLPHDISEKYLTLRLINGNILDPSGDKKSKIFNISKFEAMDIFIPIVKGEMKNIAKSPRDMSVKELRERISKMKKGSASYNVYTVEFHKKIAVPFACVLFVFLGTPFAIGRGRGGKGLGLGIGVLIIFLYYIFLLSLERIGKSGLINPALAVWIPNILFLLAGVINLIYRKRV